MYAITCMHPECLLMPTAGPPPGVGIAFFPPDTCTIQKSLLDSSTSSGPWGLYPLLSELRFENSLCDSLSGFPVGHLVSMVAVGIPPERACV